MAEIDIIDKKIVDILMEDGRMASSEIARRLEDVSERVVRYRIEQMLESGVMHVRPFIDPKKLGFSVVADTKVEVESGRVLAIARHLADYDCVTYVGCSLGEGDISAQIVAHSNEELYAFITEVLGQMPGVIKTTTTIVPMILKNISQWSVPESVCADKKG